MLNIIINCVRFCGSFELALRGHDESDMSSNAGIFRGLIDFSAELDVALKTHLESATVYEAVSYTHLDVYKRQVEGLINGKQNRGQRRDQMIHNIWM